MPDKKTHVILTTYPIGKTTPTKLKLGTWDEQKKQDFLKLVQNNHEQMFICTCSFNVHFDGYIIHSYSFGRAPKMFKPMHSQNKPNEIIIEIITDEENRDCWPICPSTCPLCMRDGQCTSPFVRDMASLLFPNKYKKQR